MNMHDVLKEVSDNCGIELTPVPYKIVQPSDSTWRHVWPAPFRKNTESHYDNLLCVPLTQFMTVDEITVSVGCCQRSAMTAQKLLMICGK